MTRGARADLALVMSTVWLATSTAHASDPDPWFGRDKALHFGVSFGIAAGGYAVGTALFPARAHALALGAGSAVAIGAAKEGADALGYGDPSWRDFTWDVVGAVTGALAAWAVDLALRGVSSTQPALASPEPTTHGSTHGIAIAF